MTPAFVENPARHYFPMSQPNPARKRMMPRDGANSAELVGGTGPIMHPISMPDWLETYKVDRTFRIQTPDCIDPDRTKPDVPWSWHISDEAGASNPIIARVFIQCAEALQSHRPKRGDPHLLTVALHTCKEDLRNAEKAFQRIADALNKIAEQIKSAGGLKPKRGVVENLPLIPNLEHDATIFLTSAKRAIQSIAEVLNQFYGITISNARFDKGQAQLKALTPPPSELLKQLDGFSALIDRVLKLRNFQEHTPKKTIVENIRLTANGILPPSWRVDPEAPVEIVPEMNSIIGGIINLAETCFFIGLMDSLDIPPGPFAYVIEEIPEAQREGTALLYRVELKFTAVISAARLLR